MRWVYRMICRRTLAMCGQRDVGNIRNRKLIPFLNGNRAWRTCTIWIRQDKRIRGPAGVEQEARKGKSAENQIRLVSSHLVSLSQLVNFFKCRTLTKGSIQAAKTSPCCQQGGSGGEKLRFETITSDEIIILPVRSVLHKRSTTEGQTGVFGHFLLLLFGYNCPVKIRRIS